RVILQIRTHCGQVVDDADTSCMNLCLRPDTGEHQQMPRSNAPCSEHDFNTMCCDRSPAAAPVFDPGAPPIFDGHPLHHGISDEVEVWPPQCGPQIGVGGTLPGSVQDRQI